MSLRLASLLLLTASVASANRPDPKRTIEDAKRSLKTAALNYTDNVTPETRANLKDALKAAQTTGMIRGFDRVDKLSDPELERTAKYLQVAEVCELQAYAANGLLVGWQTVVGVPSPQDIAAFKEKCGAARATYQSIGGSKPNSAPAAGK